MVSQKHSTYLVQMSAVNMHSRVDNTHSTTEHDDHVWVSVTTAPPLAAVCVDVNVYMPVGSL
jgi:hypothetical protein